MKIGIFKLAIILTVFTFSLNSFSFDKPKSSENDGLGKLGRINKIEKDVIKLYDEIAKLRRQMVYLKAEIKAEIRKELRKK